MKYLDKIFSIATKLKKPLSIVGLSTLVLYLIARQILNLKIFSNVGSEGTLNLITNVLNKIFWFALISLFLGFSSYLFIKIIRLRNSKSSHIDLIDASNDENMSDYEEVKDKDGKLIIKKKVK